MNDTLRTTAVGPRARRWATSTVLVGAGLVLGAGLMAGTTATAATTDDDSSATTEEAAPQTDETRPWRSDEELLTGDIAEQVEAAVLAAYPGATVHRLETDSDGVYEAHILTAEGERVIVELDEAFAVTGEEVRGPGGPGGRGGRGGHGPRGGECALGDETDSTSEESETQQSLSSQQT